MKKPILLSALTILITHTGAFAFPTVGDFAIYDVNKTQGALTEKSEVKVEVVAPLSQNNITTITTIDGKISPPQSQDLEPLMGMYTAVDQCGSMGGTEEALSVGNNPTLTCRSRALDTDDGATVIFWFGKVPFGIVKYMTTQPATENSPAIIETMILKSFKDQ